MSSTRRNSAASEAADRGRSSSIRCWSASSSPSISTPAGDAAASGTVALPRFGLASVAKAFRTSSVIRSRCKGSNLYREGWISSGARPGCSEAMRRSTTSRGMARSAYERSPGPKMMSRSEISGKTAMSPGRVSSPHSVQRPDRDKRTPKPISPWAVRPRKRTAPAKSIRVRIVSPEKETIALPRGRVLPSCTILRLATLTIGSRSSMDSIKYFLIPELPRLGFIHQIE